MPDNKGNLFLFEALELRSFYDKQIKLYEKLLQDVSEKGSRLFSHNDDEEREPANEYNQKEIEEELKNIQTKRVKLNQEIQAANFNIKFGFQGENITIAEALEIKKNLIQSLETLSARVQKAAFKRVIHKEERDIVYDPKDSLNKTKKEYFDSLNKIRLLINEIHRQNHKKIIKFKDE